MSDRSDSGDARSVTPVTESDAWEIVGSSGRAILGDAHHPRAEESGPTRAAVLIGHGFKGYKDYGFLPVLAAHIAGALPIVAHRFNFAHSGMTRNIERFERPDLFEQDTYNRQCEDWAILLDAATEGRLPGAPAGCPVALIGHSRGGVSALLITGRGFRDAGAGERPAAARPDAVVALATPATTDRFSEEDRAALLREGRLPVVSSRTGQTLCVGNRFLEEQIEAPGEHDLRALCAHIRCPTLLAHGRADPTVPFEDAERLRQALPNASLLEIEGGDHVFNTPNPADPRDEPSPQLRTLLDAVTTFLRERMLGGGD